MGAWIEMNSSAINAYISRSLPSWERGLKLRTGTENTLNAIVAPLVGAWIEILPISVYVKSIIVAPLVGAWIEIGMNSS